MKKKSVFKSMLAVMTVALFSVGVVSCSKDDAINGSTWKGSMTWAEIEGEDDEDGRVELTVTFTSDDSGNWSGVSIEGWDDEVEASESGTFQCKWTNESKGTVTIRRKKGKESIQGSFVIKDRKMQLRGTEDHWLYDDDFVFTLTRQ